MGELPVIQLDDDDLAHVTGGLGPIRQAFAQRFPIATGVLRRLGFGLGRQGCPGGNCGGGAPAGGAQ